MNLSNLNGASNVTVTCEKAVTEKAYRRVLIIDTDTDSVLVDVNEIGPSNLATHRTGALVKYASKIAKVEAENILVHVIDIAYFNSTKPKGEAVTG